MGKLNTSSNWKLATIYGGLAVAIFNPIAGVVAAAVCYKVQKTLEEKEEIERKVRSEAERNLFREDFYRRQNFSSYSDYLASETWRRKRHEIFCRANGICEKPDCNCPLKEVHHIWYPRVWGEEPLSALIGLCREHHDAEHKGRF